ncbi:hypothetical protein ILYODFUR_037780 [Ilyodon furcidens]|uniref:Uncharacterized protein n=1 Tax=Ilyodon furcidens TaxID=33524 RepID=A0ABV0VKD6_9TELE
MRVYVHVCRRATPPVGGVCEEEGIQGKGLTSPKTGSGGRTEPEDWICWEETFCHHSVVSFSREELLNIRQSSLGILSPSFIDASGDPGQWSSVSLWALRRKKRAGVLVKL